MSITYKSKFKKGYDGYVVYRITNPKGQSYIGATTNLTHRIKIYSGDPRVFKNQTNLYSSIVKWGWLKHSIEIVYEYRGEFSIGDIRDIEQKYIREEYYKDPSKSLNGLITGESRNLNINI